MSGLDNTMKSFKKKRKTLVPSKGKNHSNLIMSTSSIGADTEKLLLTAEEMAQE